MTQNIIKIVFNSYLSNGYLNPLSILNSKKLDKSAYFQPWFDQPRMWFKITPNLIKIGVHAYLSNGYLSAFSKLYFKKLDKSAYFQPWFDRP